MGRHGLTRIINLHKSKESEEAVLEIKEPHSKSWDDEDECLLSGKITEYESEHSFSSQKSVRFGDCEVRSYAQVLGDHPCCSLGCPLELGWDYTSKDSVPVDDYEAGRDPRSMNELRLSPEERREVLQEYSDGELRRACRRLSRSKDNGGKAYKRAQKEFFAVV